MKSIKGKVLVAFSLIISLCVILGAYNIYSSNKSLVYSQDIIEKELPLLIQDEKLLYMKREMKNARKRYSKMKWHQSAMK
ncbi:hypothetical protein [Peribacillus simplex]|uniref:hypothetical protein n=1 Tax=Peribacillus simplex TaxID=1478 RepID=UPI0011A3394A|nr:hypothetical protein [Peribacillus simplex]